MKRIFLTASAIAALTLLAPGCSEKEAPAKPAASNAASSFDTVAAQGKGFTVGSVVSNQTVYVMFDPQCPHCAHLWEAAKPLHKRVRFVWIPVAIINANSTHQGAALLMSANGGELMNAHEKSLLAGAGGLPSPASIPAEIEQSIKANTQLFNSMRIESVPFIMAKNGQTGQVVTHNGSMATKALTELIGLPD